MFIIDFDDTLFDTQRFKLTLNQALVDCGVSAEDAEWSYKAAYNTEDGKFAHSNKRRAEFLAQRGHEQAKILTALEKVSEPQSLQTHLLPGAIEFLESLRALGQPLILLSLGDPDFQELKVRGSGIHDYFDRLFMVNDTKEKVVGELIAHHEPVEYWFINDKVGETLSVLTKYPQIRPLLKMSARISLDEYEKSGLLYFADLIEMSNYIRGAEPRHESAGALVYRNLQQPEVIVMRRVENNTLHLPKGTLEKEESKEAAVLREIKEETGVDCVLKQYLISVPSTFFRNNRPREKITHYYVAEYVGGELQSTDNEHDEVFWLPIKEAVREFSEHGAHLKLGFENECKVLEKYSLL